MGMRCLGHVLGSDAYCSGYYTEVAEGTAGLVQEIIKVVDYGNPVSIQTAYLQLRYCAEPKIAHLLRCARPDLILT